VKKYLFIFIGEQGTNSSEEQCTFHFSNHDQIVIGVPNVQAAIQVANEFADKVDSIEFCGYFGRGDRDLEIKKALGDKVRVGIVKFT
jgi:hypothetical protein